MPFDPLYVTTEGLPALLWELGVPEGVFVTILRPDPAWQAARAPRFAGYQLMTLVTGAPDAEGRWPPVWVPGSPAYIWLARIRFGDDPVYGEIRPSAEGWQWQVRGPFVREGQRARIGRRAVKRALDGIDRLFQEVSTPGRMRDADWWMTVESDHEAKVRDAMLAKGRRRLQDMTQEQVAEYLGVEESTIRKWLPPGRWKAMKRDISQILSGR